MKLFKKLLFFIILIQGAFAFSQSKEITGTITDETGELLPGVSIIEKGTINGASTNMDGFYSLKLRNDSASLEFSYMGFKTLVISVAGKNNLDVQMQPDAQALEEVQVVGIRSSQLRSVKVKREAATVIEAITPEDIGSFSDDNVADALQRVPGIQIERNVDGISGDRVSIRGMGPQFVGVTVNGRTPISAGSEGRSDMRKFNLNTIPTEVIHGARVHKTTQASEITTSIGGSVDFQTLRPLDVRYKRGKKYFASLAVSGTSNTEFEDIQLNPRISGVLGGKITEKLGAYASVLYTDQNFYREEAVFRGYKNRNFREDTNNDGVFTTTPDANGVTDKVYENMLIPNLFNNTLFQDNRKRVAASAAIHWKPTKKLEILVDYTFTQLKSDSDRQFFQVNLGKLSPLDLLGNVRLFSPGSIGFNGNNFQYINVAGADTGVDGDAISKVSLLNRNTFFNNYTTNSIGGINFKYKASKKLTAKLDLSYSELDFFQDLSHGATSKLNDDQFTQTDISVDIRGNLPQYGLPVEAYDPTKYGLIAGQKRQIRTQGINYAARLDLEYKITKNAKIIFGTRYETTDFETREASLKTDEFFLEGVLYDEFGYTSDQQEAYRNSRSIDNRTGEYLYGETGLPNWLYSPSAELLASTPNYTALNGGSVFDFDIDLKDVTSEEKNLKLNSSRSYGAKESSWANYVEFETKTEFLGVPVAINTGVRAINTTNVSRAFSGIEGFDPLGRGNGKKTLNGSLFYETNNSRWDVLPSFNANFSITRNFNYRVGVSKGVSRPKYKDMIPNNEITFLYPDSKVLDDESDDYNPDAVAENTGEIRSGNPELKPYSAWMFDNTFELYSNNGGAVIVSVFYKRIQNYIGRQVMEDQDYPGEEVLGIAAPEGQEDLLFDITKPINITDADLYGFEVGFNQHFTFLPGFANGFGLQANYTFVESSFDGAVGDATNGFPGTSPQNFNSVLYYEKYGFSIRGTVAYRGNYLSNLGGIGSTRADEAHYTEATTILGVSAKYTFFKGLTASLGVTNLTGEDTRRFVDDDTRNLTAYYNRVPVWKAGLRYRF